MGPPGLEPDESAKSLANSGKTAREIVELSGGFARVGRDPGDILAAIPSAKATLADLLLAADRAVLDGDVFGARRLLAEALERCSATGKGEADHG